MRRINARVVGLAATFVLAVPALGEGTIVTDQFPHRPGGFASDGVPEQFFNQLTADNFQFSESTLVNGVSWIGHSENIVEFADLSNFESFVINFYADDGFGLPGAVLRSETVGVDRTSPLLIGQDATARNADLYQFDVKLTPFKFDAGLYYLSIGSINFDPLGDAFIWNPAQDVADDLTFSDFYDVDGGFLPFIGDGDMAFQLQTAAVPSPGGLVLLATAALAGRSRRRRG